MEQEIATQVVGLGGSTDFSLIQIFIRADIVVKAVIIILLLAVIGFASTIVIIDSNQYNRNQKIIQSLTKTQKPSNTLVVFFSRSGNTELMARKIAEIENELQNFSIINSSTFKNATCIM